MMEWLHAWQRFDSLKLLIGGVWNTDFCWESTSSVAAQSFASLLFLLLLRDSIFFRSFFSDSMRGIYYSIRLSSRCRWFLKCEWNEWASERARVWRLRRVSGRVGLTDWLANYEWRHFQCQAIWLLLRLLLLAVTTIDSIWFRNG